MKTRTPAIACTALAGLALLAAAPAARADFNYPSFAGVSAGPSGAINLVGTASLTSSSVVLTQSDRAQAGAVWNKVKQDVSGGFECSMTIRLDNIRGGGADGVALVIQNSSATALGGTGGAMGYGRNLVYNQAGIANSIAIALDTWNNAPADWPEGATPCINIQSNGLAENTPDLSAKLTGAALPVFNRSVAHTMRVTYGQGLMSVYFDAATSPLVQVAVNLDTLLALDQGKAWIGITAATGAAVDAQTHIVDSWSFTTTTVPAPGVASLFACGTLAGARRRRR
jgi:hypothetical protein